MTSETIVKFSAAFLVTVLVAIISFRAGRYESFPYSLISGHIKAIEAFIEEKNERDLSIVDKLSNDLNITPHRYIITSKTPLKNRLYHEIELTGKNPRRDNPEVFISNSKTQKGYYILSGTFDFENHIHGAILIDSHGKLLHTWQYSYDHLKNAGATTTSYKPRSELNQLPHGFLPLEDGSVIVATDFAQAAQRFDWCSNIVWTLKGDYHHAIGPSLDKPVAWFINNWEPDQLSFVEASTETGKILRRISLMDIYRANPDIDIIGIKQKDRKQEWLFDPLHANDVEPLPSAYARAFPSFSGGDLVISLRSLNLLFVVDPDSLKIKWWRMGLARRQHDPDWHPDGTISILDNNMNRAISRITSIMPEKYTKKVIYDGKEERFYTEHQGKHAILPDGNILIVSSQQGRVFEVTPDDDVVFDFLNHYDKKAHERLVITAASWMPADKYKLDEMPVCQK